MNNTTFVQHARTLSFDHLFLGVIIFVGIPGNLITIAILTLSHRLRRSPTSVYLASLAASDALFLSSMSVLWLMATLPTLVSRISDSELDVICKIVTYVCNVSGCISCWLVVCFTIERYFVVVHPLHRLAQCSKRNARRNVCLILPWPLLIYSCSFVFVGNVRRACGVPYQYGFHVMIFHIVDIFIVLLVPLVIIVTGNVRIGHAMKKSWKTGRVPGKLPGRGAASLRNLPADRRESKVSIINRIHATLAVRKRVRDFRTTRMLVLISICFVCLNSPHNFYRVREMVAMILGIQPTRAERKLSSFFMAFYYMNFAVNFVLYGLVSKNFRSAAKECIFHCGAEVPEIATGENISAVIMSAQFADSMVTVVRSQVQSQGVEKSSLNVQNNGPGLVSSSQVYQPRSLPATPNQVRAAVNEETPLLNQRAIVKAATSGCQTSNS